MRTSRRGRRTTAAALLSLALALPLGAQAIAAPPSSSDRSGSGTATHSSERLQYEVAGMGTAAQRTQLTSAGAAIDSVLDHSVLITADAATAERLEKRGYQLTAVPAAAGEARTHDHDHGHADEGDFGTANVPSQYHSYAQMNAAVDSYVRQYPNLMRKHVIGRSYQGRDIVAVKVSSNVRVDENKPEILFTHNMHAREHLTTEMALYTLREFGAQYGRDARVTRMLDERELWIIPSLNPDGKVYDMSSGSFRNWRKNRQPTPTSAVGTDINRNFAYRWGCCGGSSNNPSSDVYRGTGPESGTETRVLANFVRSRIVGGEQQIAAHIDFHSYSELILWPYGYTYNDTGPGLNQDDRDAFATVGRQMAASNGYRPQQSSDLYLTDGSVNDWMWGEQRIFSYTFEMYPRSAAGGGFYPPGSVINRETARNREAMLILMENADCMYRSIGKQQQYCSA
ncbi:M14 family metallopeptidase [Streptomyces sp. ACA25]|uniref:M14 family metallopeptidase n=1 Tax=Streptomyces sp. ACA25 TaxID=3022596 RepID=UPI00230734FC|nr:M14 family metallopeptidase [Streptomyces sp. ACA25]MDB1089677.1 M14 family metallopeptidase [Streptomyces sp. ACA25]